jgi:hypothetical protein
MSTMPSAQDKDLLVLEPRGKFTGKVTDGPNLSTNLLPRQYFPAEVNFVTYPRIFGIMS